MDATEKDITNLKKYKEIVEERLKEERKKEKEWTDKQRESRGQGKGADVMVAEEAEKVDRIKATWKKYKNN